MDHSLTVGTSVGSLSALPLEPTKIEWGLQDISASDAGRVQDAGNTMYKMRISQKRKIALSWTNPTLQEASAILRAFNPEYVYVRYIDPLDGGFSTRCFYVGDRQSPFRSITLPNGTVMSSLSFDIIER